MGYINARHKILDKRGNERGDAVSKVVDEKNRTYLVAASTPSYYKVIKKESSEVVEHYNTPDIEIYRIQDSCASVEEKYWKIILRMALY